jgi:hypothetical protein
VYSTVVIQHSGTVQGVATHLIVKSLYYWGKHFSKTGIWLYICFFIEVPRISPWAQEDVLKWTRTSCASCCRWGGWVRAAPDFGHVDDSAAFRM